LIKNSTDPGILELGRRAAQQQPGNSQTTAEKQPTAAGQQSGSSRATAVSSQAAARQRLGSSQATVGQQAAALQQQCTSRTAAKQKLSGSQQSSGSSQAGGRAAAGTSSRVAAVQQQPGSRIKGIQTRFILMFSKHSLSYVKNTYAASCACYACTSGPVTRRRFSRFLIWKTKKNKGGGQ
jgi:hypothetical protein